jgi:hypothetical protein
VRPRQRALGQEGIVPGIDHQRRDADVLEQRPAAGLLPVIVGVTEAVQRRRDRVVELIEVFRGAHRGPIKAARKSLELRRRLALERFEEHARVDPVESAAQGVARGGQVQRRGNGCGVTDD